MLSINDLHAGYNGSKVLTGVSLEVKKGEAVALLGPNGAGKTTLLMTISGLVPLLQGDITFEGESIRNLSPSARIKKGISHVPEGRRIFPELTVAENLKIGAYLSPDRKQAAIDTERMLEIFPNLKKRYKSMGGVLSGGEQQMLAIARALVSRPRLLLLDEPSLGLSPIVTDQIFELLKSLVLEGTTILLIEEKAELALEIAKNVYVLVSGRIVLNGLAEDLINNSYIIDSYLGAV